MNLFFDTSALIKKYIEEKGSNIVDKLLNEADEIFVSSITEIESISTFKRLNIENFISNNQFEYLKKELEYDFKYFNIITYDNDIKTNAIDLISKYQLKTLDAIQLSSAVTIKNSFEYLITCDDKMIKNSNYENLTIINPLRNN